MGTGGEDIRRFALVHEHGELAFAHDKGGAGLDFTVDGGVAPNELVVFRIRPFDDVDELFADKASEHRGLLS